MAKEEPPDFGDAEYWEGHYSEATREAEPLFDWLLKWEDLRGHLEPLLAAAFEPSILHLGTGNSPLPEAMYDAGYRRQTCVDVSVAVMNHMRARNAASRPELRWIAADCTDMGAAVPEGHFDMVIEKCTMDAFFCHDLHALLLARFVKEAFRTTAPHGTFVSISYHRPREVTAWLSHKAFRWRVRCELLPHKSGAVVDASGENPRARHNYMFICSKDAGADQALAELWPSLRDRVKARPDSDLSSEEDD